jgi:hypothetical protein
MSNANIEAMPAAAQPWGYQRSRLNAIRHGILFRHLLLPWEDRSEYDDLLESLVTEHRPNGPTEEHLVEELATLVRTHRPHSTTLRRRGLAPDGDLS